MPGGESEIELTSLVLLIVIVVASWYLSLILSYSLWNFIKERTYPHTYTYCMHCATRLEQIGFPDEAYQPPEERLGFRSLRENILNESRFVDGDGLVALEGPGSVQGDFEEVPHLDRGTEVSRSFKGSFLGAEVFKNDAGDQSLNECKGLNLNKTKLSQVRVLASPSPGTMNKTPVSLTPINAVRSSRRRSRRKTEVFSRSGLVQDLHDLKAPPSAAAEGGENDQLDNHKVIETLDGVGDDKEPLSHATSETETDVASDAPILVASEKENGSRKSKDLARGFSGNSIRRSLLNKTKPRNWSDPKKERRKGSPGHTASAQQLFEEYKSMSSKRKPRSVDIDDVVSDDMSQKKSRSKSSFKDWKKPSSVKNPMNKGKNSNSKISARPYNAAEDSEFTSQSEDEVMKVPPKPNLLSIPADVPITVTPPGAPVSPPSLNLSCINNLDDIETPIPSPNTPEKLRTTTDLQKVSLELSSIHFERTNNYGSQNGTPQFSPAVQDGLVHSSTNEGRQSVGASPLQFDGNGIISEKGYTRVNAQANIEAQLKNHDEGISRTTSASSNRPTSRDGNPISSLEWDNYSSDYDGLKGDVLY